ncbi:hypothetical protein F4859DRAFT_132317 [Xylaria cf. heliscus]|nr:hypothetical protein F4859DRAFT_132317 [Xylaria cf. heliscus]
MPLPHHRLPLLVQSQRRFPMLICVQYAMSPSLTLSNGCNDHLALRHPETTSNMAKPYFCGRRGCPRFKLRKDFKRHLSSTPVHSHARWHCCCGRDFSRKDNFRKHLLDMRCAAPFKYVCACGHSVDSLEVEGDALAIFDKHLKPCGRGSRGRPRKH